MARSYAHTNMYRMPAMQGPGGAGAGGTATKALLGDGATIYATWVTTQILASGDTATVVFANNYDNTGDGTNDFMLDGDASGDRGQIFQNQTSGAIQYNASTASEVTIDGDVVMNAVTTFPIDGAIHTAIMTANAAMDLGFVFRAFNSATYGMMAIVSISTTTVARGTELWVFDGSSTTSVAETGLGTGSAITLNNVAAGDFVTVPL